jgi:ADP-ribose pyrophosphatase YjhB (NUDIX family)
MAESHFSAGFIFKKFGNFWYALIVRDLRFKDLKDAGGMWIDGEDPLTTLIRESRQELGVEVIKAELVHEVPARDHIKHFFLVTEVNGLPALDEKRELKEIKGGRQGDVLEMRWVKMDDFAQNIYQGQVPAFAKALAVAASNAEFFRDNENLILNKFPVSE